MYTIVQTSNNNIVRMISNIDIARELVNYDNTERIYLEGSNHTVI